VAGGSAQSRGLEDSNIIEDRMSKNIKDRWIKRKRDKTNVKDIGDMRIITTSMEDRRMVTLLQAGG
jgi:hypothetical protein